MMITISVITIVSSITIKHISITTTTITLIIIITFTTSITTTVISIINIQHLGERLRGEDGLLPLLLRVVDVLYYII